MPVVTTMALMTLRQASGTERPQPFTNPEQLRVGLEHALEDAPPELRDPVKATVTRMEELVAAQRDTLDIALDRYADRMQSRYLSAGEAGTWLDDIDSSRAMALAGIIKQRETLRSLLSEQQWEEVFGQ